MKKILLMASLLAFGQAVQAQSLRPSFVPALKSAQENPGTVPETSVGTENAVLFTENFGSGISAWQSLGFRSTNVTNTPDTTGVWEYRGTATVPTRATGSRGAFGSTAPLASPTTANGFVTNELILMNAGNVGEFQLSRGGSTIDPTNTVLANIWTNANKVIYDANSVITAAEALNDKAYASGLVAHASILKALSIGTMSMLWEKVPAGIGANVQFIDRTAGFAAAISTIDNALNISASRHWR